MESTEPVDAETGDISAEYGLPDGYLIETDDGYIATAMEGPRTDSIWRAAEHAMTDYLGEQPSDEQINQLQNTIGDYWLSPGQEVHITDQMIERAVN